MKNTILRKALYLLFVGIIFAFSYFALTDSAEPSCILFFIFSSSILVSLVRLPLLRRRLAGIYEKQEKGILSGGAASIDSDIEEFGIWTGLLCGVFLAGITSMGVFAHTEAALRLWGHTVYLTIVAMVCIFLFIVLLAGVVCLAYFSNIYREIGYVARVEQLSRKGFKELLPAELVERMDQNNFDPEGYLTIKYLAPQNSRGLVDESGRYKVVAAHVKASAVKITNRLDVNERDTKKHQMEQDELIAKTKVYLA